MSEVEQAPAQEPLEKASLRDLLTRSFVLGVTSFGGGMLVKIRDDFTVQRPWVTDEQYLETLSLTQVLPGPNIVKLITGLGYKLRGVVGGLLGFSGIVGPAMIGRILIAWFVVLGFGGEVWQDMILLGFSAATVGLVACNAIVLGRLSIRRVIDWVLVIATFAVMVLTSIPLWAIVVVGGGIGVGAHLWLDDRERKRGISDDVPPEMEAL